MKGVYTARQIVRGYVHVCRRRALTALLYAAACHFGWVEDARAALETCRGGIEELRVGEGRGAERGHL